MEEDKELRKALEETAFLEQKHNIRGCVVGQLSGMYGRKLTPIEGAKYFLKVIPKAVCLLDRQKDLFNPGYCPPN